MAKEENIYSKYNTHEHGLSDAEAQKRLEENGKNIFPVGKQKSVLLILLNQFKSAIIIILNYIICRNNFVFNHWLICKSNFHWRSNCY